MVSRKETYNRGLGPRYDTSLPRRLVSDRCANLSFSLTMIPIYCLAVGMRTHSHVRSM